MQAAELAPAFYTKEELAVMLSVSSRTIDKAIANGELPVAKIGRCVRIKAEDADVFIKSKSDHSKS